MSDPTDFMKRELWSLIVGEQLGAGAARTVYAHALDPRLVVKVEDGRGSFQNVIEWQTWEDVKETDFAKWFAPCVAISPCGGILVQRRTTPAQTHPEKIPAFFTDTKLANFGMLIPLHGKKGGQFVAHDYGVSLLNQYGLTKRMRKANWWNL